MSATKIFLLGAGLMFACISIFAIVISAPIIAGVAVFVVLPIGLLVAKPYLIEWFNSDLTDEEKGNSEK